MDKRNKKSRMVYKKFKRKSGWSKAHPDHMERVKGIEPSYPAWEAGVLPLNYTRTYT